MPSLSLTDFVDVVAAAGTPKATKLKTLKRRGQYDPRKDFYRGVRKQIIEVHENNLPKARLQDVLKNLTDKKKAAAYPAIVAGHKKWWGRKKLTWFNPPSDTYSGSGVDIRVNPELGLRWNGTDYLIKLYFKSDPLPKTRSDLIAHLMATTLAGKARPGTVMGVLDVRRGNLHLAPAPQSLLTTLVDGELAYISTVWPSV